jgi:signal transduction histidine kinase
VALIGRQRNDDGWVPGDALRRGELAGARAAHESRWKHWLVRLFAVALVAGVALVFVHETRILLRESGRAIDGMLVSLAAMGLVLGPWLVHLARRLSDERSRRIRSQERAELAAHLHDSVLQTLALIQRRADDSREVAGLARRQERELRQWLFDRSDRLSVDTFATALGQAAEEIEAIHDVRVEVVTVSDCCLDGRLMAMVAAAREALTNAAKFSGGEQIDLFGEVHEHRVEVFVRDRGVGFDPAGVPDDRRGLRDSIVERMRRHGGRGEIHAQLGEGTEIELVMELPRL